MRGKYIPPTLIFEQNPQDCMPSELSKRKISIQPPSIDEVPEREPEVELKSDLPESMQPPPEELDEVEQLFLRVQAECNMSRLYIKPMLDEIEEEQARLATVPKVPERPKPEVRIENLERREETTSCVITFRSMGPVKVKPPTVSKRRAAKIRKRILKHPEWVEELLGLCIELKKVAQEIEEWQWKDRKSLIVERRLMTLKKVGAMQRREELQQTVIMRQKSFPEQVQTNIRRFLGSPNVVFDKLTEDERISLKNDLFPGLVASAKEFLCKYRGSVEFPYKSLFNSEPFIELLKKRKCYTGWLEAEDN